METVSVNICLTGNNEIYEPSYISFGDNCVIGCENSRNMGFLLGYCSKEEAEIRRRPIEDQMNQYNVAVEGLWSVPGFKEYFALCHSYTPISDIERKFGLKAANMARNICRITNCYPDLVVIQDALQLRDAEFIACFEIEGKEYSFDVKNSYVDTFVSNGNICAIDWSEEDTDLVYSLINQFIIDGAIVGDVTDEISQRAYYAFQDGCSVDCFTEAMRYTIKLLSNRGFLKQYALTSNMYTDVWNSHTRRKDNSVLFTILDPRYKKDKLLRERISCLWNALYTYDEENGWEETNIDLQSPFYFLQDANDHVYISPFKALLGGYNKKKIYGRLDCPSANRYLSRGHYVKHRVFFKDEETAIAAGYRPCGICMKEAYNIWKQNTQNGTATDNNDI